MKHEDLTTQVRLSTPAAGGLQNFDAGRDDKDSYVRGYELAVHRCAELDLQRLWNPGCKCLQTE